MTSFWSDKVVFPPDEGYVPDSLTAAKIAEAVWLPIYGDATYDAQPFVAVLDDKNVWTVQGTRSSGGRVV